MDAIVDEQMQPRPGATYPSHKTTIRLNLGARESSENSGAVRERRADREGLGLGLVRAELPFSDSRRRREDR